MITDKISNEEILTNKQMILPVYNSAEKYKMAFAGHVLPGSSEDKLEKYCCYLKLQSHKKDLDGCGWMASNTGPNWTVMRKLSMLSRTVRL